MRGVCSADDGIASAQGRGHLPSLHQQREIPRNNLSTHTNRLMSGHAQIATIHRNGFALDLVCPTSIITIDIDSAEYIYIVRDFIGFPIVEGLQASQVVPITLNEVGQLVDEASTLGGVHGTPGAAQLEGFTCSLDSLVHISLVPFLHITDLLPSGRVDGGEGLATHYNRKMFTNSVKRPMVYMHGHG